MEDEEFGEREKVPFPFETGIEPENKRGVLPNYVLKLKVYYVVKITVLFHKDRTYFQNWVANVRSRIVSNLSLYFQLHNWIGFGSTWMYTKKLDTCDTAD